MIDVWMMFSNFYPFVIVILQVLLQNQREKSKKKSAKTVSIYQNNWTDEKVDKDCSVANVLDTFCKVILPLIGSMFVVGYFTYGLCM